MQLQLFDKENAKITATVDLVDIFESYLQCRQNKRNTANAIAFEIDYEQNLITLWRQINEGTYRPNCSIAFIIENPVKREVFAADFKPCSPSFADSKAKPII